MPRKLVPVHSHGIDDLPIGTGTGQIPLAQDIPGLVPSAPLGGVVYVDGNYTGTVENGSIAYPFKTIAAATAAALPGQVIKIAPMATPYIEDVTLPASVSCEGYSGVNSTRIQGAFVVQISGSISLRYLSFYGTSLTIHAGAEIRDCWCRVPIVCDAAVQVSTFNLYVGPTTAGAVPLTINGPGQWLSLLSRFQAPAGVPAVVHNGGWLLLSNCEVTASWAGGYALNSTGGNCSVVATQVLNTGGGGSMDLTNGATAAVPNAIASAIAAGNVNVAGAVTLIDNLIQPIGTVLGAALPATLYSPGAFLATGALGVVWAGSIPTNRSDAVNRIAAALATHLGVPIP